MVLVPNREELSRAARGRGEIRACETGMGQSMRRVGKTHRLVDVGDVARQHFVRDGIQLTGHDDLRINGSSLQVRQETSGVKLPLDLTRGSGRAIDAPGGTRDAKRSSAQAEGSEQGGR